MSGDATRRVASHRVASHRSMSRSVASRRVAFRKQQCLTSMFNWMRESGQQLTSAVLSRPCVHAHKGRQRQMGRPGEAGGDSCSAAPGQTRSWDGCPVRFGRFPLGRVAASPLWHHARFIASCFPLRSFSQSTESQSAVPARAPRCGSSRGAS